MLRSMVNIDSKSKHNFGHFVSYIIYLARFCKDIDISHCVAIHFVYDLHAIRMDQFFGSDTDVNSINLHASLRYFCLHHKKNNQNIKTGGKHYYYTTITTTTTTTTYVCWFI